MNVPVTDTILIECFFLDVFVAVRKMKALEVL